MTLLGYYNHRGVHRFREHANVFDRDLIYLLPSQQAACLRKVCPGTLRVKYQLKACKKYRIPKNHFLVPCQKVASARRCCPKEESLVSSAATHSEVQFIQSSAAVVAAVGWITVPRRDVETASPYFALSSLP